MKKNIKKSAGGKGRKVGLLALLVALLVSRGMAKAAAEEITGTIVFEPYLKHFSIDGLQAYYPLTTDGLIANKLMISPVHGSGGLSIYAKLHTLLREGSQIVFEDDGLKFHDSFKRDRVIAIILQNGTRVELTQLFSLDEIKLEFPYLYAKLEREKKQQGQGR